MIVQFDVYTSHLYDLMESHLYDLMESHLYDLMESHLYDLMEIRRRPSMMIFEARLYKLEICAFNSAPFLQSMHRFLKLSSDSVRIFQPKRF